MNYFIYCFLDCHRYFLKYCCCECLLHDVDDDDENNSNEIYTSLN